MGAASQVLSGTQAQRRVDSRASSSQTSAGSYARLNGTNLPTGQHNKISPRDSKDLPAFSITVLDRTSRVQQVMREFAGNENAIAKVETALQCSSGSAKNYLEGKSTPSGIYDDRAMAVIPGYLALKMELAGLEMTLDPRHQQKLVELARYISINADNIFGGE